MLVSVWFCPHEMSNKMCAGARARGTLGNFEVSDFLIFKIFRFSDFQICVRAHARAGARARVRGVPLEKNELLKFK